MAGCVGAATIGVHLAGERRVLMESGMSHVTSEQNTFDVGKAIAAVAYLVEQTGESMYPVMKMMYLADKLHLERHGRFIAGDEYAAMKQGPVPSCTYTMIKHVRGERCSRDGYDVARQYLAYTADHYIKVLEQPDYDELSGSDVRALDDVVTIYKRSNKWAIRDLSHDGAWSRSWSMKLFRRSVPMPLEEIAREFEDSEALLRHLEDSHPGEAQRPKDLSSRKSDVLPPVDHRG